jgi:peptidoglycan/LPS O-acetylase OafA/YrhL
MHSTTETSSAPRLYFLDGLRGFGALIVVLTHVFFQDNPITTKTVQAVGNFALLNGHFAVWVFFIVSGFSLSVSFLRTGNRRALSALSVGRYFRLSIPILAFSLIFWLAIQLHLVPDVSDRWGGWSEYLTFRPSFFETLRFSLFDVFFRYDEATSINPPLWTMSYELGGSMIVLGMLALIGHQKRRWIVYLVLFAIVTAVVPYLAAFLFGLAGADFYLSGAFPRLRRLLTWLAPLLTLVALLLATEFPDESQDLVYLGTTTLFFTGCLFSPWMKSLLESRLARFLGRIAFPLYLIHTLIEWTLTVRLMMWAGGPAQNDQLQRFFFDVLTVGVSLLLARALVGLDAAGIAISRWTGAAFVCGD